MVHFLFLLAHIWSTKSHHSFIVPKFSESLVISPVLFSIHPFQPTCQLYARYHSLPILGNEFQVVPQRGTLFRMKGRKKLWSLLSLLPLTAQHVASLEPHTGELLPPGDLLTNPSQSFYVFKMNKKGFKSYGIIFMLSTLEFLLTVE